MELLILILCQLNPTALIAFRCCCQSFEAFFTQNATQIIYGIVRNQYYVSAPLYGIVQSSPQPPTLKHLKSMERRYATVDTLANAIAHHYVENNDHEKKNRMAHNLRPYLLALGHFFEVYRSGLVNYTDSPYCVDSFSDFVTRLESEIFATYYNEKTAQRIFSTYTMINQILSQRLNGGYATLDGRPSRRSKNLNNGVTYIFGGLELVTHFLTLIRSVHHTVNSHLAKIETAPRRVDSVAPIPPFILDAPLSREKMFQVRKLVFSQAISFHSLPLTNQPLSSWPPVPPLTEIQIEAMGREFLKEMESYTGEEPELGRENLVVDSGTSLRIFRAAMASDPRFEPSIEGGS